MEITEALQALNPDQDDHWTKAGLPSVDAVGAALGHAITREEITAAAEGFNREASHQARMTAQSGEPPEPNQDAGDPRDGDESSANADADDDPRDSADADDEADEADDLAEELAKVLPVDVKPDRNTAPFFYDMPDPNDDPEACVKWLESTMDELATMARNMQTAVGMMNAVYQRITPKDDRYSAEKKFQENLAHYKQSQQRIREERGEQLKALRESGLSIKDVATLVGGPSQLDRVLQQRPGLGSKRQKFHEDSSTVQQPAKP